MADEGISAYTTTNLRQFFERWSSIPHTIAIATTRATTKLSKA